MHGLFADLAPRGLLVLAAVSKQIADPRLWYVTRAAAIAAYVALTASTGLGLLRSIARVLGVGVSWVLDELHQFIALLAAAFVVLHLLALLFDPFLPFPFFSLVLPFGGPYRPLAHALGVLGLYALAVVLASSWLRRRMTYQTWRVLHYASFAAFALVTLHGLLAGADTSQPWMRAIYTGAAGSVAFLVLMRVLLARRVAETEPVTIPLPQLLPPGQSQH